MRIRTGLLVPRAWAHNPVMNLWIWQSKQARKLLFLRGCQFLQPQSGEFSDQNVVFAASSSLGAIEYFAVGSGQSVHRFYWLSGGFFWVFENAFPPGKISTFPSGKILCALSSKLGAGGDSGGVSERASERSFGDGLVWAAA